MIDAGAMRDLLIAGLDKIDGQYSSVPAAWTRLFKAEEEDDGMKMNKAKRQLSQQQALTEPQQMLVAQNETLQQQPFLQQPLYSGWQGHVGGPLNVASGGRFLGLDSLIATSAAGALAGAGPLGILNPVGQIPADLPIFPIPFAPAPSLPFLWEPSPPSTAPAPSFEAAFIDELIDRLLALGWPRPARICGGEILWKDGAIRLSRSGSGGACINFRQAGNHGYFFVAPDASDQAVEVAAVLDRFRWVLDLPPVDGNERNNSPTDESKSTSRAFADRRRSYWIGAVGGGW